MYADKITNSMKLTIDETNRRREIQTDYNVANGITPTSLVSTREQILQRAAVGFVKPDERPYIEPQELDLAADPVVAYMSPEQLARAIQKSKKDMEKAAKDLNFVEAARLRDEMFALQKVLDSK